MLLPRGKKHLYKHQASPSVLIINLIEALMAASEKPEARTTKASSLVLKINKLRSKLCPGQGTLVLVCSCLHSCPSPVPPSPSPPLGAPPSLPLLQPPPEPFSASPFCSLPPPHSPIICRAQAQHHASSARGKRVGCEHPPWQLGPDFLLLPQRFQPAPRQRVPCHPLVANSWSLLLKVIVLCLMCQEVRQATADTAEEITWAMKDVMYLGLVNYLKGSWRIKIWQSISC